MLQKQLLKSRVELFNTHQYEFIKQIQQSVLNYYQTNMDFENQDIRPLEKRRIRNHLYHQISDWEYTLTAPDGQVYLISLNSYADVNKSLIDVFLNFFSCIYQTNPIYENNKRVANSNNLNVVFKYMIELYHLYDKYIPQNLKKTLSEHMYLTEIMGKYEDQTLKSQVKEYLDQCKQEIDKNVEKFRKSQLDEIRAVRLVKSELIKKHALYILSLPIEAQYQKSRRAIYIPMDYSKRSQAYVHKLLNKISNLQFTKKNYRLIKMQHFQKTYKTYLQPIFLYRKNLRCSKQLTLKRYTLIRNPKNYHMEEVLISLNSLFQITKQQQIEYNQEYIQMMRQLGNELKRHNTQTNQFYPFLHPKYIIINQISLRVHLSYYMPLLSALGLLKMPMSTQQRICFEATPQIFDFFSAPNEHFQIFEKNQGLPQQIFYDLHYGLDHLIETYDKKIQNKIFSKKINEKIMPEIKLKNAQISQAWRFIMIFSYLMNGQYYFKRTIRNFVDTSEFSNFLKDEFAKYKKDVAAYVKSALGKKQGIEKIVLKQANSMSLSIFDDFFSNKQQQSSHSASPNRFYKIDRFLTQKHMLYKDIEDILLKQTKNCKMNNPTRYLLIFYLNLFESMFHIHMLCSYYLISYKIGQEIFNQISNRITITKFGQVEDKKSWIDVSFKKLEEYQKNSKGKKGQNFKVIMQKYEQIYQDIEERNNYLRLKARIKQIIQESQSEENKSKLKQVLRQVGPILAKCQKYIKTILRSEFGQQQRLRMFEYSLQTKIRLFLIITQDNFVDLDSLIFPFLRFKKKDQEQGIIAREQSAQKYEYMLQIIKDYEQINQTRQKGS